MSSPDSSRIKIAAVQMNSGDNPDRNFENAAGMISEAREQGATLVSLPENFSLMPATDTDRLEYSEADGRGPSQSFLEEQARAHEIWIVGGTVPIAGDDGVRVRAASLIYDPTGRRVARYDKIHLFDVEVDEDETYKESDTFEPGPSDQENLVCVDSSVGRVGLTVCYDLRFPEMYRALKADGAALFTVPSAFTETTGRAHWETLLRARAIENQCYVVAAAQTGTHPSGRRTYGNTMIVGPWGDVLARRDSRPGIAVAEMDREAMSSLHKRFPSWRHRRL